MKALFYIILGTMAFLVGCGGEQSVESRDQPVESPKTQSVAGNVVMRKMQFSPMTLDVKRGDTVEWKNEDIVPHTVTSSSFDSGSIAPDQSWRHTFSVAGEFSYICSFHPTMKGNVIVK